ncbi:MAG: RNA-binding transcriptional accessory protein [Candidatus Eremiobacteraeota bacterium]|nr:RNA-binding transcriptional accessory protein [Candidatus Eremiobacteraeota bacterium]MCW5869784.1 RNA-binding transcriptional accessory protein [Candidatus Eremiobacteraeota bacterium]
MIEQLAQRLQIPTRQVEPTVKLLEEGNTLPFIARYRKEVTGGLDEEQIRQLEAEWKSLKNLEERRQSILATIQDQLTPELRQKFEQAQSLTALEDLYLPYRPRRKTRATLARERGLEPLARLLQKHAPIGNPSPEELAGAQDILAEEMAENPEIRSAVREKALRFGKLKSKRAKGADEKQVYAHYYSFEQPVAQLKAHQILALDRGEKEKVLSLDLVLEERDWRPPVWNACRPRNAQHQEALEDGVKRLLLPAIERDVRRELTEYAQRQAIASFAANLRGLLTIPPLNGYTVLGLDPGFRTGCKLAVVDPTGKVLATDVLYLHQESNALKTLQQLCQKYRVNLIAIGNGTASRESEQMVASFLKNQPAIRYLMVSEAGASVYSASPLARAELPDLDVSLRGAVSIARRVQDPLAELVKIEPKSIGVGMYQHDLEEKQLNTALAGTIESVVNQVGVDLNTASPALLAHVAGIGPKLAEKVVAHRNQNGAFKNRAQLRKVAGFGPKAFEQSAGFLRVRGGDEPLDASAIHPESYAIARALLKDPNQQLEVGEFTKRDILEQLQRPGRDPREDLPPPLLRQDVLSLDDLTPGLVLHGTVRNVVDFGAFVDLGVKQDGLLHRSQLVRGQHLSVGQVVEVEVLEFDRQRGRISLKLA